MSPNEEVAQILMREKISLYALKDYPELNTAVLESFPEIPLEALREICALKKPMTVSFRTLSEHELRPSKGATKIMAMTKDEYMTFHKECCDKMIAITKAKNSDYTGASEDPFSNFQQIGSLVQLPGVVEIGFITRMSDKLSRIGSFVTKGTLLVKDESVEDTLLDLANYCILFAGYLRSKRGGGNGH